MKESEFRTPHTLRDDFDSRRHRGGLPLSDDYITSAVRALKIRIESAYINSRYIHENAEYISVVLDLIEYMRTYKQPTSPSEYAHLHEAMVSGAKERLSNNYALVKMYTHKYMFSIDPKIEGEVPLAQLKEIFDGRFYFLKDFVEVNTRIKFVKPYITQLSDSKNKSEREFASEMMQWLILN